MSPNSSQKGTSEPDWSKAYRNTTDVLWYNPDIDSKVNSEIRDLLETYSEMPPSDVLKHVRTIRDKAWAIRSYPCTGLGLFLNPMLPHTPPYKLIIQRLQAGQSLLDIGCFLGQDLRRLVADGAPADRLFALDVVNHWDLGYEMFRDIDKFSARYIETDILNPSHELQELRGTMHIISMTHVLHQWDWNTQIKALKELVALSSGSGMIVGFQIGTVGEREKQPSDLTRSAVYLHDPASFQEIWNVVGQETDTKWECEACLKTWADAGWDPKDVEYLGDDARILQWVVNRLP
ncbi:hypothetical protein N7G274_010701 [Stereocaulon virgatum]|uniref:Methyltransferase domain-containing protein n=1 Tax=Stereocaulon virgatum TaxID=373712 RepID=A0ABR3ZU19_9LECA